MTIQNATWQETNGTSFHSQTLRFTYNDLKSAFGFSDGGDGEKVNCEWNLKIGDIPFTIYDWKEQCNPEYYPDHYFEWHIGSHSPLDLNLLVEIRKFIEFKNNMKELADEQAASQRIKTRIGQIGEALINLAEIPIDTPNHNIELSCALGVYIKCLKIQLDRLELLEKNKCL